jgi:alanine dehydrogenase
MSEILLIDESVVRNVLTLDDAMIAVRQAFIAYSNGLGIAFPVVKNKFNEHASFSLKSGYVARPESLGVKAAGSWKNNPSQGLPTVQATVMLFDVQTGVPQAIIAGKTLTTLRTGAAGGLAADLLSRRDAAVLAVVGTGVQAEIQTEAVLSVRPGIQVIRCCDPIGTVSTRFIEKFSARVSVEATQSVVEATIDADIVITATPSTSPLIDLDDVKPGVHVNAIGCDAKGKREIGANLLLQSSRFTDSLEQAMLIGEHQYLPTNLRTRELGSLLGPTAPEWQRSNDEITLFDSTGIAFQDLVVADLILKLARERNYGKAIEWAS